MSSTELPLFNPKGEKVGTREVSTDIFGSEVPRGLLHQIVRWQRAKKRAGTHTAKTRSEVRGGGRKPFRQKGLGRARAGSIRSPLWVGGGVAHGPKQRSYEFQLNKKERRRAMCGALAARNQDGKCLALTEFGIDEFKTKRAAEVLSSLGIERGKKVVVVTASQDTFARKSLGNIEGVTPLPVAGLNVYDVVHAEYVVLTEQAIDGVQERLG